MYQRIELRGYLREPKPAIVENILAGAKYLEGKPNGEGRALLSYLDAYAVSVAILVKWQFPGEVEAGKFKNSMSELEDKIKSLVAKGNLRGDILTNHPAWNIVFDKELKTGAGLLNSTEKTTGRAMYGLS